MKKEEKDYTFFKLASPDRYAMLKAFAAENRANPTEAESCMWQLMKGRNLGVRFRRQYIIGDYIADFVCIERHLVVEVDGGYHEELQQQRDDAQRTSYFEQMGFRVVRFTNEQVMFDTDATYNQIINEINKQ